MYSNPQTSLYIPLGPGTVVPRDYGQPLYVKLNVILWLRAGRPLYFSNNGVVLAHCDVEPEYLDISVDEPQPRDAPEPAKELRNPKSAEEMMELINSEKVQQERVRALFTRLSIDKPYARELLRRIHAEEPETKQVRRHMLLWLDNLDLGAIARFVQYENHPEREYNRSRLRSRQSMSEGHFLQGWSLIPPKEIDDRDPWSILGYSTPKLIVDGDGVTSRSLFMVHPLVLSKDQAKLVKADEEVLRFDHIWTDITSKSSTARTSGEPQQDEEDDSAHVAEREMTWFIQNVNNLVLNPWMVYDIGMVSLHDRVGTRVLQSTGEDVILVRDWDRLTRHQREYFCRRYKLLRPSVYGTEEDPKTYAPSFEPGISQWMELAQTGYQQFFFIRAWENGRRWAEILTGHGIASVELSSFLDMCRDPKLLGWNFGIPEPQWDNFGNTVEEAFNNPLFAKLHYRFKQEEEIGRVMHLVSELVCDFFIKVLPKWVLDHSILWEEFMILDPDTNLPAYKTSEAALQAERNPEKYHTHFAMNFKKFRFSARIVWYLIDRDRNHLESFLHNSNSRFVQHACYQLREYVQARVAVSDPLYEMIKKEEFERQYNSKFLEAISCSRVVVEPVSSGTYEPSSKLNLKVLQDILKGIFKIQKDEEPAKERDEEEEQAAQNISYLLADDMELDFDDDDVPVWRSIVNKYRESDQVLQGEAVKITHLFRDQKDNEKATEAFSSERTDFYETSGPLPRTEGENLVEDLLNRDVAEQAFEAGEEVPPYTRVSTIAGEVYTGSMTLLEDEDMEEEVPEEDPAVEPGKEQEIFDEDAGVFPSEELKMEVDQEEAKEESTPHFLSREIGEDSTASHLPSGEMDANLDDNSGQRKSKKSRLNKIPDPHFHEEVQDDATMEEKKEAVEKIKEVREDDGEKKLEAEIQESFPSEVVVEKDTTKADNTYELHTSPLKLLGELTGDPGIGLYQLCFRETHARLLNHVCFRKGEISHPHYQSRINENDFVRSIRNICPVPPPDCYEHEPEHDLKRFFINDDRIIYLDGKYQVDPKALERAGHAREELEDTKKELKKELESYGPKGPSWDFVTFYEELCRRFLKGRIEEPYGTNLLASSESLTFLSWNYGNMVRGQKYTTPRFLQGLDSAMRPRKQSAMSLQNEQFENNLFFNMLFFLRAHVVILQEAHLLVPAKEFIEQKNWTVCFNDWENLAVMARLAPGGYVKIIAGHDQDLGHCEQRDVTWAIYEICFGETRPRQDFKDADFEFDDYGPEDKRVPLTRANMHTIRVCNYHVDTHRAVDAHLLTGEQTALMLYECFVYEVDIISGDANSLAYRMYIIDLILYLRLRILIVQVNHAGIRKQAVVESTKILQRGFRRLRQRWQQGRKMDFAAVVRAAQGQRKDWAIEFQIEADDAALNQLGFVTAIQKVHQISHGKAEKLWQGFLSQSENSSEQRMGLPIFWAICEAVARGDADAAECADLSLEEYLDGEMEGQYSEEEVQAARRIQAAQRGLNARAQADVTKAMASVSSPEQAAERIQAAFAGRLVREELLEAPVSPDLRAEQATAAEKIQAVYRGRQVRQEARQAGGLDRRSSQEAAAERIQAAFQGRIQREVFRVEDLTQEEASARIQAVYRGRQAREQAAASMGFRSRQERSRPLPGADLFEEALAKQGGGGELLLQAGFLDMISKAAPEISEFQAQALFEGTCVGTGQMGLSSKLFCELLQAIRLGDEAAAQFADMHIEDYRSLLTADKE
ncbi:unnamed protein product [Durusdinium trenchii]|uniref:Uncharacterized protein n=1 Tax=Durusdinium trenchii TaxID=1381693 RepID=A0ABP0SC27_9DINO